MPDTIVYIRGPSGNHAEVNSSGQLEVDANLTISSLSGQTVKADISGQAVKVSGETVKAEISGQTVQIAGGVNVSGQTIKAEISGQTVSIAGGVNVSGQTVKSEISGQTVKAEISGQNVKEFGSTILTGPAVTTESLSGGTELGSGVTYKVEVRSFSGNSVIWIGGTAAFAPHSGKGFELFGGEAKTLPMDNINKVRLYPGVSGQKVSYIGFA